MTGAEILAALQAQADPANAQAVAAYHKVERVYLGVTVPQVEQVVKAARAEMDVPERVAAAAHLWDSDVHEARVAAGKLLTQARIRPDDAAVWAEVQRWVPTFDAWAVADHAAAAGSRRLVADPDRLDTVETWTTHETLWVRRAALVFTLPWTKLRHPSSEDLARRERILGWAESYVPDRQWFIQKAIAWWLRDLSKHDPDRVQHFLAAHGADMKPFAVREASKYLGRASA